MPNVGRPSGACHTCKRMKVKCGEEKPQCNRCCRANRRCPGYGPKPEMFRHSSIVSQGKPAHRAASFRDTGEVNGAQLVDAERQQEQKLSSRTATPEHDLQQKRSPVLNLSITADWEQQAPRLFFHFYTIATESDNIYGGHMSLLEDYCNSYSHIPYLLDALRAVALIDTSHRANLQPLCEKAMSYRAKALYSLQQALCDKAEARKDHVLLALFLLERFECISGENQSTRVWYNHSVGMSAMLHLRGQSQFETAMGRELFRWINLQLTVKDLGYGTKLAYQGLLPHNFRDTAAEHSMTAMLRLADLLRQLGEVLKSEPDTGRILKSQPNNARNQQELRRILASALQLEEYFDLWHPQVPVPKTALLTVRPKQFFHDLIAFFPKLTEGMAYSTYWVIRLRWSRFIVDCSRHLNSSINTIYPHLSPRKLLDDITYCADKIHIIIPFLTGEVDTTGVVRAQTPLEARGSAFVCLLTLWRVNSLIGTPELEITRPGLRKWAFERLLDLRHRVGLKQAYAFYQSFQGRIEASSDMRNFFEE